MCHFTKLYNLYLHIRNNPNRCKRLTCGDSLFTVFNCRLTNKFEDLWSNNNYILYVMEGRKIWHTGDGSYDLREGDCVFVRKGAAIVEQFRESEFCFFLFFVPDEFICDVLKSKSSPIHKYKAGKNYDPVIAINSSATVQAYFQSMLPYFDEGREPDQSLIELKFKELILTIADNPENGELLSYFCSLLQQPQAVSLQQVMEANFCFNIGLEEFARMRFEHHHPGSAPCFQGGGSGRVEHGAMAAMHAVEITDGEASAFQRGRNVMPAANDIHQARRSRVTGRKAPLRAREERHRLPIPSCRPRSNHR